MPLPYHDGGPRFSELVDLLRRDIASSDSESRMASRRAKYLHPPIVEVNSKAVLVGLPLLPRDIHRQGRDGRRQKSGEHVDDSTPTNCRERGLNASAYLSGHDPLPEKWESCSPRRRKRHRRRARPFS